MKQVCFTTFVFGNKYIEYIPLFVYSIKKAYPKSGIVIFCHSDISNEELGNIEKIGNYNDIKIINKYQSDISLSNNKDIPYGAALRWLVWDDSFLNYQRIYIADIDIFYCKEEKNIYEQHEIHMRKIGKPFSNIIRHPKHVTYGYKEFLKDSIKVSLKYAIKKIVKSKKNQRQLSGLHYTSVDFHKSILRSRRKYIDQLRRKTVFIHHKRGFNDEAYLYDIVSNELDISDICQNTKNNPPSAATPTDVFFRPHHGLHLGIFRNKNNIKANTRLLNSKEYLTYYKYFIECYHKDKILIDISRNFPSGLKQEINNMINYYEGK
ncbi:hypothetical protein [Plesiomonas shigelloides]|uniref:hypothetical protein n=1 Tax=Plesiomonas shigelloides TaxID=703 RepID=UPI0031B74002